MAREKGILMVGLKIDDRTPEQRLRDDAWNIVYYWSPRLGKRQRALLGAMHVHGPGFWGGTYEYRQILQRLERRELAKADHPPHNDGQHNWQAVQRWKLTKLGSEVARILVEECVHE